MIHVQTMHLFTHLRNFPNGSLKDDTHDKCMYSENEISRNLFDNDKLDALSQSQIARLNHHATTSNTVNQQRVPSKA